jgi:cobalt-zinc-cadmium efflux system outer membrane protein
VKLIVAHEVLELCAEVREAYYEMQAAQQLAAVNLTIASAAQASYDSAAALHRAGNLSDLRLAEEQGLYESARLEMLECDGEVAVARERINRLLGLWGADAQSWKITAPLPGVPRDEVSLATLERLAIRERLDLAAAKRRTELLAAALGMAESFGWLHLEEIGAAAEREDDIWKVGPHVELELPLFDQGQAQVAARQAELRQSYQRVTALAVDIRSEVRAARDKLVLHRRKAEHYRDVVIPLRERIVELTMEQYNFMLAGVFELLEKKRDEADAYRQYVRAVRDYWVARAALQRAAGGKLPRPARPAATVKPPAPPPKKAPHHGH